MRFYTILQIALLISFVINVHFSSYAQILPFLSLSMDNDSGVAGLDFSNDGKKIIAGGRRVHIWDISTGAKIKTFNVEGDPFYGASSVALSPSEKYVVVGGPLPYVTIWDINTEKIVARAVPEDFPYKFWNATNITAVAFTNDEENIVIGDISQHVSLWDWKHNRISELFLNDEAVVRLYPFPASDCFLINYTTIFSVKKNATVKKFLYSIFPSSDGKKIYSCYHNKFLVHNSETFEIIQSYPLDTSSLEKKYLDISPTGNLILVMPGEQDKTMDFYLHSVDSNTPVSKLVLLDETNYGWSTVGKFSKDGNTLALANVHEIYLYDLSDLTSGVKEAEALGR